MKVPAAGLTFLGLIEGAPVPSLSRRSRDARPRPFLRWVGGKARLATRLLGYVPVLAPEATYFEPFAWRRSLFFIGTDPFETGVTQILT